MSISNTNFSLIFSHALSEKNHNNSALCWEHKYSHLIFTIAYIFLPESGISLSLLYLRVTSNSLKHEDLELFWSSYLHLSSAGITAVCHHPSLLWYSGPNPEPCARWQALCQLNHSPVQKTGCLGDSITEV